MKEIKDLMPADLMGEGRRWVIAPGDYIEGKGFRVDVVFENHPFHFPVGQITNLPDAGLREIPYLPAEADTEEAREASRRFAEEWSEKVNGINQKAYLAVISSSIKAYEQGKRVKVLGDDLDHLIIQNGFGDEIELDEEAAIKLYQDLAATLDLPCQRNCPTCGMILEGQHCEDCDD